MPENKNSNAALEAQRELIINAKKRGKLATLGAFCRLSGPGWMQSATTLGGGSLASALYLGVLGGFGFMWLQPLAMLLGIVMLAAISYVTLSISEKPMRAVNRQISPILGYGWALGSLLACLVFAMPQFSLAVAAIEQNLAVGFCKNFDPLAVKLFITAAFFALSIGMIVLYARGGKGVKAFEIFIKASVAAIVVCFFGVVIQLTATNSIEWSRVWEGFIPNFSVFSEPSEDFKKALDLISGAGAQFWSDMIVSQQRDVVISAAAMAVGINMTFLFPYSMLKKGWNKDFRELAIFDLATGLFIPFLLATSCIVVASASQFHAKPADGLEKLVWSYSVPAEGKTAVAGFSGGAMVGLSDVAAGEKLLCFAVPAGADKPAANLVKPYAELLDKRLSSVSEADYKELSPEGKAAAFNALAAGEKTLAAMLVKRDASNLSDTLAPLVGEDVARYIFGFGVLGMAMNAILMNMLICGLCFCEVIGKLGVPKWQVIGSMLVAFSALASIFWEGAKMWLVIHAGVIAMVLLPIAYGAFLVIMNSKKILGESAPRGKARVVWNVLMSLSVLASSCASLWVLWNKLGVWGPAVFVLFLLAVALSNMHLRRKGKI